jgi:iron complex outermembrane receptor protein
VFEGLRIKVGKQTTTDYNQDDDSVGILYGMKIPNGNLVIGLNALERSPLSASEIDGIAELGLSGLGKTFKVLGPDTISSGLYAGFYPKESQFVPDPNCEDNGGILDGNFCRFLYGERFNIVNDESHRKIYVNFSKENNSLRHNFHFISSKVEVNDNPQSPSYPALPFLSRNIEPGEGGSPFNVPVVWYGRPLGSAFDSPLAPRENESTRVSMGFDGVMDNGMNWDVHYTESSHASYFEFSSIISHFSSYLL